MSVVVKRRGPALVMMIDRPAQRNAVNRTVSMAMAAALDELDADPALRVGIVTGAGGNFCSGMDLKAFVDGERPELEGRGFAGVTERGPAKPLIAAVEGYALAGGCELALACDLIVASETAVFGLPEAARGLVAGSGGLVRLRERIPPAIALEYALTAKRMDAATAQRWGLVNRLVPAGQALDAALTLAEEISANAPLSVAASKAIMAAAPDWPVAERWERQRPMVEAVLASDDAQEGARAFAEKRAPIWSGR
ncbi:crotonase/enoyl-CoA hydratase family protein [Sphingomonas ginsenosidimutans]|jgi:enoyl-CoA hydratase|uniref:crotonase/enoyl-CoA hydratase family protein n=3 Tax=Sphingomonas TaxID=13687 RepID=UPI0008779A87|nr:crotonase/enoyl-CoA hydratase family protein [Sphingomonas ginsenosidimutans]MBY0301199.1 crotonase/enoyl-CoA hydratase family protein [Sphingomonas ginsenosidimutans]